MRKAFFVAALMLGTAAVAQETMQEETTTDTTSETMTEEAPTEAQTTPPADAQTMPPAEPAPAPAPAPTPAPMPDPQAAPMAQPTGGGGTVAPSNQNPETDARGIKVLSDAAMAPSGANQAAPSGGPVVPAPNQAAVFQAQPSSKEYPTCSRTMTDGCVQSYERGRASE